MSLFRRPWGSTLAEQARSLEELSTLMHRRVSANPWDKLSVCAVAGQLWVSGGQPVATGFKGLVEAGRPKPRELKIFSKRQDAERYIQKHYREVRERVQNACHY